MTAGAKQRRLYRFAQRGQVRGVFYLAGGRRIHRLCSLEEARVASVTAAGEPAFRSARDRAWSDRYLRRLYQEKLLELRDERERVAADPGPNVQAALDDWIALADATREPGTVAGYRTFRDQYLEHVGNHRLAAFGQRHIDKLVVGLRSRKRAMSTHTINNRLNGLRAFLRWSHTRGLIAELPKLKLLRATSREPDVLTPDQLRTYAAAILTDMRDGRNALTRWRARLYFRAMMVALGTGMREGEIQPRMWADFELWEGPAPGGRVRVVEHGASRIKERREKTVIVLPSCAAFLLQERKAHPDEVYLLDDGHGRIAVNDSAITHAFTRYRDLCGFTFKPFHVFRATFITEALERGVPLPVVQTQVGHSSIFTTARYAGRRREAMERGAHQVDPFLRQLRDILPGFTLSD